MNGYLADTSFFVAYMMGIFLACTCAHAAEPLIVAHRGASADAPENTLPAFELAWRQGADAIEGDFYRSKDGAIVCIHDADTKRVAGIKRLVRESTLAELRGLDVGRWRGDQWAGTRIPTLAEVLAVVPAGKRIYIEVKDGPGTVPKMIDEIEASGLEKEQVVVIAFDADVIRAVKTAAPQYKAYWLSSFKEDGSGKVAPTLETILATLKRSGADGFSSSCKHITRGVVEGVQNEGYEYHVWTVDDPKTARRLKQWGAKSITTNVPGLIKASLAARVSRTGEAVEGKGGGS